MKKFIFLVIIGTFIGCKSVFTGCGNVTSKYAPEPRYTTMYDCCGHSYKVPSGNFYYKVSIKGEDGKSHKVYVSYNTWVNAKPGDLICVQ